MSEQYNDTKIYKSASISFLVYVFRKFAINFYAFKFYYNQTKMTGILHKDLHEFCLHIEHDLLDIYTCREK